MQTRRRKNTVVRKGQCVEEGQSQFAWARALRRNILVDSNCLQTPLQHVRNSLEHGNRSVGLDEWFKDITPIGLFRISQRFH
jgi:hypothetical protein